jgi:hypothetical protein
MLGILSCALAFAWAGSARADTAAQVPPQPLSAPGSPSSPPVVAPIELDVALSGETQAERRASDPNRSRFEGLVLFSAADGVGGGGQLRSGPFGLRATVAYQPLLFLVDADPADKTFGAFEFSNSFQLNVDALLVGTDAEEQGGSVGYRFNDLLGHGISVAYQSAFDAWGQHFNLSFPVTYYPSATQRVRDRLDIASGYEINFPFGAGLQFGMGAAWIL